MKKSSSNLLSFIVTPLLALALGNAAQAADMSMVTKADKTFVHKVGLGGMFEVDSSKIAADKATSPDLKAFAENEVKEHTQVGDNLKAVATAKGIEVPMQRDEVYQKLIDALNSKTGKDFDETYYKDMVKVHDVDGGLFAKEAKTTKDPDLKDFASKTDDIVNRHIKALKDMKSKM